MLISLGGDLWHNQRYLKDSCNVHPPDAAVLAAIPSGTHSGQDVALRCLGVTKVPASHAVLPGRYRCSTSLQEFRALCGHRQHSLLPLPGRLHRQLLRGAGGRVLPQPLPEWSHLHGLPGRLLL